MSKGLERYKVVLHFLRLFVAAGGSGHFLRLTDPGAFPASHSLKPVFPLCSLCFSVVGF